MPPKDFNFYSLIVPFILFYLSFMTLWVNHHKKLADYLVKYAWALSLLGMMILLNTILPAQLLSTFGGVLAAMYFVCCSLHTQVLYQRLSVDFSWKICLILIVIGTCCMFVFSNIYDQQMARIFTVALVMTAIHLHRPIAFFKARIRYNIDVYLKVLNYLFVIVVLSRGILLILVQEGERFIAHYGLLWALTQFVIIVFYLLFFALFVASALYDIVYRLNEERHLDPLTGLLNRRGLKASVSKMKHAQYQHAVLMVDIDHFKSINDNYGHAVGDQVLQHVSHILGQNIRQLDQVARIGGEEFVIILHDLEHDIAYRIAERIRHSIEQMPYTALGHQPIYMTLSIGISYFQLPEQIDHALLSADKLLYKAKNMGRNQVQFI